MKKLGNTEFDIMKVLWRQTEPVTSNFILHELSPDRKWKLASLMTSLQRLAEKGFLYCDRTTRTNFYTAIISEAEYKTNESVSFLERLYSNSVQKLVAELYSNNRLSQKDIKELRNYLDELEKERGNR